MSQGLNKTKRRIKSVQSTRKITKAMQLIATAKVKKLLKLHDEYIYYSDEYRNLMGVLSMYLPEESHYSKENADDLPTLYIVVTSDLGLCGAYNSNVLKYGHTLITDKDYICPLGSKAMHHFNKDNYGDRIVAYDSLSLNLDMDKIIDVSKCIKDEFNEPKWKKIMIVYTHYVNSITSEPAVAQILPIPKEIGSWGNKDSINVPPKFDENPKELMHNLMLPYMSSVIYSKLLESQLAEQSSRRTAMDNANDNADELLDKLTIEYNKARQSAITQEITEVVGGAEN